MPATAGIYYSLVYPNIVYGLNTGCGNNEPSYYCYLLEFNSYQNTVTSSQLENWACSSIANYYVLQGVSHDPNGGKIIAYTSNGKIYFSLGIEAHQFSSSTDLQSVFIDAIHNEYNILE